MSFKSVSNVRLLVLLVLVLVAIPTFSATAAGGAITCLNQFGLCTPEGSWDLVPGDTMVLHLINSGPVASVLNVTGVTPGTSNGALTVSITDDPNPPYALNPGQIGDSITYECDAPGGGSTTLTVTSDSVEPPGPTYTLTVNCVGDPDIFFGNFGGHTPDGITYPLVAGETVTFFLGNHGAQGSILHMPSASWQNTPQTGLTIGTLVTIPDEFAWSGTGEAVNIRCRANIKANNLSAHLTINTDDPETPSYDIFFTCNPA